MRTTRQLGVTLIEIMIVLAIIALIMGFLVGPKVIKGFAEAKKRTAWMMAKEYESAYAHWLEVNEEECPTSVEDLSRWVNKKDTKDPWGSAFVVKCGASAPDGEIFGVLSLGPDKQEGTEDDIASWKAR
jgi:general secretion pathway protein G